MSTYNQSNHALLTCAEVRQLIQGILANMHLGILTKTNLHQRAEDLLLSNSDYWLSYAGAAFIGWLLADRHLAEQGLKRALNLDDARTSLFFLLVSLREKRAFAAEKWLQRYLDELDPWALSSDFVCLVNTYVAGLLPTAAERQVSARLADWQKQQAEDPEITGQVQEQWCNWFHQEQAAVKLRKEEHFQLLSSADNFSTEKLLKGAHLPETALADLTKIIQAEYKQQPPEEETAAYLDEFIENNRAADEKEAEKPDLTYAEIFLKEEEGQRCFAYAELLSLWVLESKRYGASTATRQYALASLKDWIRSAAEDVQAETIQAYPGEIHFHMNLSSFNGHKASFDYSSLNGKNERENLQALHQIIEPWKQEELDKNRPGWKVFVMLFSLICGGALLIFGGGWVITNHPALLACVVGLALIGLLGLTAGIVVTIILALLTALIVHVLTAYTTVCVAGFVILLLLLSIRLFHTTIGNRRAIEKAFADYAKHQEWDVCSYMAETADLYDFYTQNIIKQQDLRDFLTNLHPEDFVRQRAGRKIRV